MSLPVTSSNILRLNKNNSNSVFARSFSVNPPLPTKTKLLAWSFFLIFFIDNGTLGIVPQNLYFVYRNVRISDLLIYMLAIYSFFCVKEYEDYFRSKALLIPKLFMVYLIFQFVISVIQYNTNFIEYFFRLKGIWSSTLIFPLLLLIKRNGLNYLIRLVLPAAIISNVLYIGSALTGVALLPDIGIEKQSLPGGLVVNRVFGGTFYGEIFFLGIIFNWITNKFKLSQLPLVILFGTPHILAFGRSAWIYLSFTILLFFFWNSLRTKDARVIIRQAALILLLIVGVIYLFKKYIPDSDYYSDALDARVEQGKDDYKYGRGTYGSRLMNIAALVSLWQSSNIAIGIGMHPMWVIKPETQQEFIYIWGFSDLRWASVLAAYGLIGLTFAAIFQIFYLMTVYRLLKKIKNADVYVFFLISLLSVLLFDTLINYTYYLFTLGLWGLPVHVSLYLAVTVTLYEKYLSKPVTLKRITPRNKYVYKYNKTHS